MFFTLNLKRAKINFREKFLNFQKQILRPNNQIEKSISYIFHYIFKTGAVMNCRSSPNEDQSKSDVV